MRTLYCGKDGWPPRSMLAKMIEEGSLGASVGRFVQHHPECLDEDALAFSNALKQIGVEHRDRIFIHYCVIGKGKVKAARMEETKTVYYDRLDNAHKELAKLLPIEKRKLQDSALRESGQNAAIRSSEQNRKIGRQQKASRTDNLVAA